MGILKSLIKNLCGDILVRKNMKPKQKILLLVV